MDATEGNICSGSKLYSLKVFILILFFILIYLYDLQSYQICFYLNVQGEDASSDCQNGYDSC